MSLILSQKSVHFAKPLCCKEVVIKDVKYFETVYEFGGEDLNVVIGKLQPIEIIDLAEKTLEPLAILENEGIFHSDIKPSSFVILNGIVKIIDFSVSRAVGSPSSLVETKTTTGHSIIGVTQIYYPPELFLSQCIEKNLNKIDVYCWGMMMYQIMTGKSMVVLKEELMKYKEDGKNYDDFLKIVSEIKLLNDPKDECAHLLIPILLTTLSYKHSQRPTFSKLKEMLGEKMGKAKEEDKSKKVEQNKEIIKPKPNIGNYISCQLIDELESIVKNKDNELEELRKQLKIVLAEKEEMAKEICKNSILKFRSFKSPSSWCK